VASVILKKERAPSPFQDLGLPCGDSPTQALLGYSFWREPLAETTRNKQRPFHCLPIENAPAIPPSSPSSWWIPIFGGGFFLGILLRNREWPLLRARVAKWASTGR
jgi:hypothetical protein